MLRGFWVLLVLVSYTSVSESWVLETRVALGRLNRISFTTLALADGSKRRPLRRPIRRTAQTQKIQEQSKLAAEQFQESLKDPTLLSAIEFSDPLLDLSPGTLRAIHSLGLRRMTEIQAKTWAPAVSGKSILGRSRTGTGKSLAFLLPATQRLTDLTVYRANRNIGVLVIAPTRELAMQIAETAKPFFDSVQSVCGTKIGRDRALLNQRIPAVLVATPGRLLDHLESKTRVGGRLFSDILGETKVVALDEADRLFQAFPKEMNRILSYLPRKEKRQTMLYSATISKQLKSMVARENNILPEDYVQIDCINDDDTSNQTNLRVEQSYMQLRDMKSYLTTLISILQHALKEDKAKIVVFFPTAKLVNFVALVLEKIGFPLVLPIHSRMSQAARNRASTQFRQAKNGILLTSDVSARGVDYPDVSLVVQYGAPFNDELYLHRLGRTARAGKQGSGLLVLLPFESSFLRILRRRGVPVNKDCDKLLRDEKNAVTKAQMVSVKQLVRCGHVTLTASAEAACKSFVAHYVEYAGSGVSGADIAEEATALADSLGLAGLPALPEPLTEKIQYRK